MQKKLLINGRLVAGQGDVEEVLDPATAKVIARVPGASGEQIEAAVQAAEAAFAAWAATPPKDRGALLRRLADRTCSNDHRVKSLPPEHLPGVPWDTALDPAALQDLTNVVPLVTVNTVKLIRIRIEALLQGLSISVRRLGTRAEGRRLQEAILAHLETGREPVVVLDLNGLEMMNSSFADEVIATPLQRILNGEHGERYFVVDTPTRELVEDVQRPLEKRDLSLMCFQGFPDGEWWVAGVDRPAASFVVVHAEGYRRSAGHLLSRRRSQHERHWEKSVANEATDEHR